ncbi:MAG: TauD/TfdA family dioxygenase [Alphaproteobacteria bacterium]|nr:TauD/TfdA family dioxygenase [Alphaproteobacteria bacterium]MCB9930244.1 TauD/TfdA family dioxygenase [Alphaproteobacteria bacterium]
MSSSVAQPGGWTVADLERDPSWRFRIDEAAAAHLADTVRRAYDPDRPLFAYTREDFDFGPALDTIRAGIREAHHGRGLALVQGLPRAGLGEDEFRLLNWAIGLHSGVARPQGKASQYISAVRDAGTDYRSAGGRGYSSNAKLDFHVDGSDLVTLACYNKARVGGQSMITSTIAAWNALVAERPDLAEVARQPFQFSRQNEQAPDEGPYYGQPLVDFCEGRLFGKWNRNRVLSAQRIEGVPPLTPVQQECLDVMDGILQRPAFMFTMFVEPGDMQIMNNHIILHSRTDYEDFADPAEKRLLFRLWMAPPDSVRLPDTWWDFFRSTAPGTVRGGIRGHCHDAACLAFERRQAASLGMPPPAAE